MKRRYKLAGAAAALLLISLKAFSLSGGPISGQVIDTSTGKPVADAIVVAYWRGDVSKIVESGTICLHVDTARTGVDGRYQIPGWSLPWSWRNLRVTTRVPTTKVYKAGYFRDSIQTEKPGELVVRPITGTKAEQFESLIHAPGCADGGESRKSLYQVYMLIAQEAEALAETREQTRGIENIRRIAKESLVNTSKPTAVVGGRAENIDANDNYRVEDVMK